MTALDDLLAYLFDGGRPPLYLELESWLLQSRRFKEFVNNNRVKIRAKLRNVRDEGGMEDLGAELETAALLLREPRFNLTYEKYAATRERGPDFTVTFKTHTSFNVEVRRIRRLEGSIAPSASPSDKLTAVLCDKVGQMPPGLANLLWIKADHQMSEEDLIQTVTTLRRLADRKAEEFFQRQGYDSAADFLRRFRLLSAIVLLQEGRSLLWLNPLARHKVPPAIVAAVQRLIAG
jgi:hypothetical protein